MSSLGFSAGATPARNYVHDWASEAWQEAVKGNVSLVAEHPALLAYCESRGPVCRFGSWRTFTEAEAPFLLWLQISATTAARWTRTSSR